MPSSPTIYHILRLPASTSNSLKPEDVKSAFHRALLRHHPDKQHLTASTLTPKPLTEEAPEAESYSIDEIIAAYQTLADPARKAAYDANLNQGIKNTESIEGCERTAHPGIEVHDLDDLTYDEAHRQWTLSCRCADVQGYVVSEEDLERASGEGEIYVGCQGCSLFVKITFSVVENESEQTEEQTQDV